MSFRQSLAGFKFSHLAGFRLPERSEVARAAAKLPPGDGLMIKVPPDLNEVANRIRRCFIESGEPDRRDLRHAPWCIWGGGQPFSAEIPLLRWLLAKLLDIGRKSFFRSLVSAFLMKFCGDTEAAKLVGSVLTRWSEMIGGIWRELNITYRLFDPAKGPKSIAAAALARQTSVPLFLAGYQIGSLPSESGFAEYSFIEGLKLIRDASRISPADRLAQIRSWGLRPDNSFLFVSRRGELVDSLVLPYVETALPKESQKDYLEFLIGKLGDPRTKSANWVGVGEESKALVRKWLTGQTLKQFLDVVDHFALAYQWQYRRAFWEAIYDHDLIEDAWVIFDVNSAAYARTVMSAADFGQWDSRAKQAACLLMRIGNGIIAEWSHNGACNIWRDRSEKGAPTLYRRTYLPWEVRKPHERHSAFSRQEEGIYYHHGSESYGWQQHVANEIYSLTRVRIPQKDYRLRRG